MRSGEGKKRPSWGWILRKFITDPSARQEAQQAVYLQMMEPSRLAQLYIAPGADPAKVARLMQALREGRHLPPIMVVQLKGEEDLAFVPDGRHRALAALGVGVSLAAEVCAVSNAQLRYKLEEHIRRGGYVRVDDYFFQRIRPLLNEL